MSRRVSNLVLGAWCLFALSCATASGSRAEHLANASRSFHDALLFQNYQAVAGHLLAELRPSFLTRAFGTERSLSVTELEIVSMTLAEDGTSARTLTRISYFELPSTTVRTEAAVVDWVHRDGAWHIERIEGGPLPVP